MSASPQIIAALDQAMAASSVMKVTLQIPSTLNDSVTHHEVEKLCICVPLDDWQRLVLAITPLVASVSS